MRHYSLVKEILANPRSTHYNPGQYLSRALLQNAIPRPWIVFHVRKKKPNTPSLLGKKEGGGGGILQEFGIRGKDSHHHGGHHDGIYS